MVIWTAEVSKDRPWLQAFRMAKGFCIIEKEVELRGWEPSLEEKSQEADR